MFFGFRYQHPIRYRYPTSSSIGSCLTLSPFLVWQCFCLSVLSSSKPISISDPISLSDIQCHHCSSCLTLTPSLVGGWFLVLVRGSYIPFWSLAVGEDGSAGAVVFRRSLVAGKQRSLVDLSVCCCFAYSCVGSTL